MLMGSVLRAIFLSLLPEIRGMREFAFGMTVTVPDFTTDMLGAAPILELAPTVADSNHY